MYMKLYLYIQIRYAILPFVHFFFSSFFPLLQGQVGSKLQKFVFNRKIEYSKGEKILQ